MKKYRKNPLIQHYNPFGLSLPAMPTLNARPFGSKEFTAPETPMDPRKEKIMLIGGGVALAGAVGYGLYQQYVASKNPPVVIPTGPAITLTTDQPSIAQGGTFNVIVTIVNVTNVLHPAASIIVAFPDQPLNYAIDSTMFVNGKASQLVAIPIDEAPGQYAINGTLYDDTSTAIATGTSSITINSANPVGPGLSGVAQDPGGGGVGPSGPNGGSPGYVPPYTGGPSGGALPPAPILTVGNFTMNDWQHPPLITWQNPPNVTWVRIQATPQASSLTLGGAPLPGFEAITSNAIVIAAAGAQYSIPVPYMGQGPYVLLPDLSYQVQVDCSFATQKPDGRDDSQWGQPAVTSFQTPQADPTTLHVVNPVLGSSNVQPNTILQWTDTNTAIFEYWLELSDNQAFAGGNLHVGPVLVHGGQSSPLRSFPLGQQAALQPGMAYYWRVAPWDGSAATPAWSSAFSFTTSGTAGATPAGSTSWSLTNDVASNNAQVVFTATTLPVGYSIQFFTSANATTVQGTISAQGGTWQVTRSASGQANLSVYVRVYGPNGSVGAATPIISSVPSDSGQSYYNTAYTYSIPALIPGSSGGGGTGAVGNATYSFSVSDTATAWSITGSLQNCTAQLYVANTPVATLTNLQTGNVNKISSAQNAYINILSGETDQGQAVIATGQQGAANYDPKLAFTITATVSVTPPSSGGATPPGSGGGTTPPAVDLIALDPQSILHSVQWKFDPAGVGSGNIATFQIINNTSAAMKYAIKCVLSGPNNAGATDGSSNGQTGWTAVLQPNQAATLVASNITMPGSAGTYPLIIELDGDSGAGPVIVGGQSIQYGHLTVTSTAAPPSGSSGGGGGTPATPAASPIDLVPLDPHSMITAVQWAYDPAGVGSGNKATFQITNTASAAVKLMIKCMLSGPNSLSQMDGSGPGAAQTSWSAILQPNQTASLTTGSTTMPGSAGTYPLFVELNGDSGAGPVIIGGKFIQFGQLQVTANGAVAASPSPAAPVASGATPTIQWHADSTDTAFTVTLDSMAGVDTVVAVATKKENIGSGSWMTIGALTQGNTVTVQKAAQFGTSDIDLSVVGKVGGAKGQIVISGVPTDPGYHDGNGLYKLIPGFVQQFTGAPPVPAQRDTSSVVPTPTSVPGSASAVLILQQKKQIDATNDISQLQLLAANSGFAEVQQYAQAKITKLQAALVAQQTQLAQQQAAQIASATSISALQLIAQNAANAQVQQAATQKIVQLQAAQVAAQTKSATAPSGANLGIGGHNVPVGTMNGVSIQISLQDMQNAVAKLGQNATLGQLWSSIKGVAQNQLPTGVYYIDANKLVNLGAVNLNATYAAAVQGGWNTAESNVSDSGGGSQAGASQLVGAGQILYDRVYGDW